MSTRAMIETIMGKQRFAVAGVSRDPEKYGYKVYVSLKSAGYTLYAINPEASLIDGDPCYPSLDNIPGEIDCLVTVTPPQITEELVTAAGHLRIPYLWMQPGSESLAVFNLARSFGMEIVSGGPCIMVAAAMAKAKHAAQV